LSLLRDTGFYISEGWANFSRAKTTTFVSIFIIAVSIAIISIFTTLFFNINNYLTEMKRRPFVNIYLKKDASVSDITILKNKLELFDGVSDLNFIPANKGLELLYKRFSTLKGIENELDDNPIPDAFVLRIDRDKLNSLKTFLQKYNDVVDEVYTPFELFEKIDKLAGTFSFFALVFTIVLIISSVITIYNVIKITIVSRKEDIGIMQLVGANMRYIRMPFVFEGMLQGFFGGILGLAIGSLCVIYLSSHFLENISFLNFFKSLSLLPIFIQFKLLMLSVLLGIAGSLIASLQIEYT